MVSWYTDGGVSGFSMPSATLAQDVYRLASNGMADTQGVTRLQYKITTGSDDRISANAHLTITTADLNNNYNRRLGATMFVAPASSFAPGHIPTNIEILGLGPALLTYRSSTYVTVTGQADFHIAGPRASALQANTKYWVLVMPTSWVAGSSPSQANDRPMTGGSENTIGRGISMWTNRTPAAPTITSPQSGTVYSAGADITFSFTPTDSDVILGSNNPAGYDMAGIQVQYAAKPTVDNPSPVWKDLPFTENASNGGTAPGTGWYVDGNLVAGHSGARDLWLNLTGKIKAGTSTIAAGEGILPSGSWQIRMRTFDYGNPYPGTGILPWGATDVSQLNPSQAPAANASPWSTPVNVTISAQVPAPIALSPKGNVAVVAGQPLTLSWQYRNTANPPYPQGYRRVQVRYVGTTAWTEIAADSTSATTYVMYPSASDIGKHYEWRVQVTDSTNTTGDWSDPASFWVVAAPSSGSIRPVPTDTAEGATLGCGTHRVYVYKRGGKVPVGELTQHSHVDWERKRDDISTAQVVISGWDVDCGNLLKNLQTWAYEVVIFRDNGFNVDRVWEGPITLLTYEVDKVTIDAKDVMAFAYRRIIKQDMTDTAHGDSVTSRAIRVLQNALAPDDPNVLGYMQAIVQSDDAMQYRSMPAYSRTAFEEVDDMAANAGLDYTVIGRAILLWGTKHRIGTLPEFRDENFGSPPIVSEYGMSFANFYSVGDGQGNHGDASRLDVSGNDPDYGLVEMLSSTWASDSADDTGTYTAAGLASTIQSFAQFAERSIADRYPPPVLVRVPDGTTLNPDTVVSIQHLVPGVAIPLRSTSTLREVYGLQKLDSIKVTEEANGETITVTMSSFSADDASLTAGADG